MEWGKETANTKCWIRKLEDEEYHSPDQARIMISAKRQGQIEKRLMKQAIYAQNDEHKSFGSRLSDRLQSKLRQNQKGQRKNKQPQISPGKIIGQSLKDYDYKHEEGK